MFEKEKIKIQENKIYNLDCLEGMKYIKEKSVDLILCDLPYGITQNYWDKVIDLDKLWVQYERIIKDSGNIILFSSKPFTTKLINSKEKLFRYEIIWLKNKGSNCYTAEERPLNAHENILVFYKKKGTYNVIKESDYELSNKAVSKPIRATRNYGKTNKINISMPTTERYPISVIYYPVVNGNSKDKTDHSAQKPIPLIEWLINVYSNENDVVLDNCIGSGTTAIACIRSNRHYIGFEIVERFYKMALERIRIEKQQIRISEVI